MKNITENKVDELFDNLFPQSMSWNEIYDKLNSITNDNIDELRSKFCDLALDAIIRGFYRWRKDFRDHLNGSLCELFMKQLKQLKVTSLYYNSVSAFFDGDFDECLRLIDEYILSADSISVYIIDFDLLPVFKDAFPGFWQHVKGTISGHKHDAGTLEFISAIEAFYKDHPIDIIVSECSKVLQADSECVTVKEMLAITYAKDKMWNNALAYWEQINEPYFVYYDGLYFNMAWAYGKVKARKKSIEYYQKCLQVSPTYSFANNNLGWEYIKSKAYTKAIAVLQKCLGDDFEFEERKYASNNLVLAYLGVGMIDDAQSFAATSKIKLWKATLDRLDRAKSKNSNSVVDIDEINIDENIFTKTTSKIDDKKTYQFTNEKILEDELESRIQSGQNVFGKHLKIYIRNGEYGRQYIIPIGRIDLLAEDEDGNLYIIELKKDSGYDDAYKQIVNYIDWFETNKIAKDKKVYGIICLNNPSPKLIKATKNDSRIMLYEYVISYTEIK